MTNCTVGVNVLYSVLAVLSLSALNRHKSGRSTCHLIACAIPLCYVMPHV